jgi:cytochrome c peroxidase
MNEKADRVTNTRRNLLIGIIVAGLAAAVAVALLAGGGSNTHAAQVPSGDPHAGPPVSQDVLNAVDKITLTSDKAALAAKGRELFRSSAVSKSGESCQSCHTEGGANAAVGTTPHDPANPTIDQSFKGVRDVPTLFNVGRTDPYFWIGDVTTLNEVSMKTILNHFKPEFNEPNLTPAQVQAQAAALTAYMQTITPPVTDFDRGTMSAAALAGEELFQGKAACVACHGGPDFTDNRKHDTFVPQRPGDTDPGATPLPITPGLICPLNPAIVNRPLDCTFNTPTLRGIGLPNTAPFMHNGIFPTLEAVVSFYNTQSAIAPLQLTVEEQAQLVAYLKAL